MSEDMSEDMPNRMPDRISENILNKVSEDLLIKKYINNMMEIIRNKKNNKIIN